MAGTGPGQWRGSSESSPEAPTRSHLNSHLNPPSLPHKALRKEKQEEDKRVRNDEGKVNLARSRVREMLLQVPGTCSHHQCIPGRSPRVCGAMPAVPGTTKRSSAGGNSSRGLCLENAERYFCGPLNRIIH